MQLQNSPESQEFHPALQLNPDQIRAITANSSSSVIELPHIDLIQLTRGMGATRGGMGRRRREKRKIGINTPPPKSKEEEPQPKDEKECQET